MKSIYLILLCFLTLTVGCNRTYRIEVDVTPGSQGAMMALPVSHLGIRPYTQVALTGDTGQPVACQAAADGTGEVFLYWRLPDNAENAKAAYKLETGKSNDFPVLKVCDSNGALTIREGNTPILEYHYATAYPPEGTDTVFKRSGFIHPAWSPSGNVLTNIQPVDHRHHYGVWNPWTRLEYDSTVYDLWNLGDRQGTVRHNTVVSKTEGPVWAGFTARLDHIVFKQSDVQTEELKVMDELWDIKAWTMDDAGQKLFIWDFTSSLSLSPSTTLPIVLKAYRYGGFGYRATAEWTKENCIMQSSEGKARPEIDGTNGRWVYVTGDCANGRSGLLLMGYPENHNFPEPIRIWDQNANEGRGDAFINFAPTKFEDWTLEAGSTYRLRYRAVAYDGDMTPEKAERLWNTFAHPPAASVE